MEASSESKPWVSLYTVFNVGLGLITFNAYAALISPGQELWWTLSFLIYASAFSALLFLCLYLFDRSPENLESKERLKILIWVLGAMLFFTSARWVSMSLSPTIVLSAWAFAGSTSLISFYFFFVYGADDTTTITNQLDMPLTLEEV